MHPIPPLYPLLYEPIVRTALEEDLGRAGDRTTDSLVPPSLQAAGSIVARQEGRIAGIEVCLSAFRLLDPGILAEVLCRDGIDVKPGGELARLRGAARPMLSAERTALNFLGRLCGIATATRGLVRAAGDSRVAIVCTRKTTPGLRGLEKYAVRMGGGANHRFGLDDAILIKDNHLAIVGDLSEAVARARQAAGHMVKIEVEVDTLAQLEEVLRMEVDAVLLDNMDASLLQRAVQMAKGKVLIEASGGITLGNVAAIASTGVDLISVGWITHSASQLDVTFEIRPLS